MRFEVPEFKRCCFCLPLRYGLLVWSYLLLVPLTLILIGSVLMIHHYYTYHHTILEWMDVLWATITVLILLCNLVLNLLLIVAAHMKSLKLLKIYYMYALISVITTFISSLSSFVYDIVTWFYIIQYLLISLVLNMALEAIFIVMQIYIIGIVRSEILKLENNHSFKFFNNAAELEIAYYDPDSVQNVNQNEQDLIENTITEESKEEDRET